MQLAAGFHEANQVAAAKKFIAEHDSRGNER
jgi:hypothetical protein